MSEQSDWRRRRVAGGDQPNRPGQPPAHRRAPGGEVDGGIDPATAPLVVAAGADVLVAGSAVFRGGSVGQPEVYGENIRAIKASVAS